jgi:two-component system sensor histidine kinase KdpD
MDIDAILWRKPALAIVDELAHSNVPGSRHTKRWQDVEELLAAGIDVYTTLNIQHLESLNDIVARISRVRVRETLPDKVLELAEEIELIDLPPDDLIQRLREGKVYVRDQVGRAIRHFFSKGNLTAFRELAMRLAAERVDAQMLSYMRRHAIPGPWPTQERLLVCIGGAPSGRQLVRSARRAAERLRVPWIAVHVATPKQDALPDRVKDDIADTLRLAESLGGEAVTLHAEADIAGELIDLARKRNVTRILVGHPRRSRLLGLLHRQLGDEIVRRATDFEITLIAPGAPERPPARPTGATRATATTSMTPYLRASLWVGAATAAALAAERVLPLANLSLIFLTAVLLVATRYGLWPSIYAGAASFLAYNFFFTVPYHSFSVARRDEVLTLFFFLLTAVVVGNLAGRLKMQVEAMRTTTRRTTNLYDFSRRIAGAASLDDVLWAGVHHVASTLQCQVLVLLPDTDGRLAIAAGFPPEDRLASRDWGAAEWAWQHDAPAGWGSDTLPSADWLFLPMKTRRGPVGLLGISFEGGQRPPTPEQRHLLEALVDQVAVAIERTKLATDIEETRVLTETEQLRTALLSSVSHDLRTPLVSIIGSATSLGSCDASLSDEDRRQLIQTILEESERLNRYVQNLLDMTRLGYGALQLNREWTDLREIAGRSIRRSGKALTSHRVQLAVPEDLPAVLVDPVLVEQVLVNLLDNAAKYAPEGGCITIAAHQADRMIVVRVSDQGPGIPAEAREAVFDVFYRVRSGDRQAAGTGLGLAICRGLIEAHGGTCTAKPGPDGIGTTIEFTLPLQPLPAVRDDTDRPKDLQPT